MYLASCEAPFFYIIPTLLQSRVAVVGPVLWGVVDRVAQRGVSNGINTDPPGGSIFETVTNGFDSGTLSRTRDVAPRSRLHPALVPPPKLQRAGTCISHVPVSK